MEQNVLQCLTNNVFGTLNVAEEAVNSAVSHVILVSTDKAVNPTNFMGASKRLAEIVCNNLAGERHCTQFAIVRFGNVLGSSGSVVPLFKQQIAMGGPVTITHVNVTRYFMTIPEAAQLVIQAGALTNGNDTFVLDMGTPVKIIELAQRMIVLAGKKPVIEMTRQLETDEIGIKVIGLRPGEKMCEELSYTNNLSNTVHPKIKKTDDKGLDNLKFKPLLNELRVAIDRQDDNAIFSIVAQVCEGVSKTTTSSDVFLQKKRQSLDSIE
jgi:FlaA1/EpsC-like NDP-sugar epimerase